MKKENSLNEMQKESSTNMKLIHLSCLKVSFIFYFIYLFFILIFIVIQLQLSAFSPHPSTPPQPNPPHFSTSTLPLDFVHVSL